MRSSLKLVFTLLVACVFLTGCWQAKVTTNKEPGDKVIEKKWVGSFVGGLVGAKVDVSGQCPNGIASAERKISIVNGLVAQLTGGLYVPQTVTVTCAASGSMSSTAPTKHNFVVPQNATDAELQKTLSDAATQSRLTQKPATVHVVTD
ncbi:MAG TPA: hypothetical protein VJ884_09265 [Salinibacter sp.]|nr:hypothetical protein [Salinibacter sp.]